MQQAIVVSFSSSSRGQRLYARALAGRTSIPFSFNEGMDANFTRAVLALMKKLNWEGTLVEGCLPNTPECRVYVFAEGRTVDTGAP